ncbi:MAG: SatD family protein [Actinomycetia bacterium]|nr:SatD family protein [Actinomycetes bacterium]
MDLNAVITGDLVKSSRIKDEDIGAVLKSLKRSFNEINNYLLSGDGLFEIYRGDSFQIVVKKPEKALLVSILLRSCLRTFQPSLNTHIKTNAQKTIYLAYSDARISIGIGTINYNEGDIVEWQGDAFKRSGQLLDRMIKGNKRLGINTPWVKINKELEVESMLADAIISRWTATTAETIYQYLLYQKSQREIAEQFNIKQPSVHKRLVKYGNIDGIEFFIKRYNELVKSRH